MKSSLLFTFALLAILLLCGTANSTIVVWKGVAGFTNWSTAGAWVGSAVPLSTDTVKFDGTAISSCYVDNQQTCAGVIISGFTFSIEIGNGNLLEVDGDFTQTGPSSGVFFQGIGPDTLSLLGNLTVNSGSFNTTNSVIRFTSVDAETVKGVTSFNILDCVENGHFYFFANTTVSGTLNMYNGTLVMNGDTLSLNVVGALNPYVDGAVAHTFNGAATFVYPVASISGPTASAPVTVQVNSGTYPATLVVQTRGTTNPPAIDENHCIGRRWYFNTTSGAVTLANVTFDYSNCPINGTEANYVLGKYNGSAFALQPSNVPNTGNHTISINAVSPSSIWAIGEPGALPIVLNSFTASSSEANAVTLNWSTTSETNTYGFYVERRSGNGTDYTTVSGLIEGAGTSLEEHQYAFIDAVPSAGTYFYRLKEVDLDGTVTYLSDIRVVVNGALGVHNGAESPRAFRLLNNYPNPFNPSTIIRYELPQSAHVLLTVYNVLGQEVAKLVDEGEAPGIKTARFDAANVPSGVYYFRLQANPTGDGTVTGSFVEVKKMQVVR